MIYMLSFIQTLSLHKKKGTYYIQHISYSNQSLHALSSKSQISWSLSPQVPTLK